MFPKAVFDAQTPPMDMQYSAVRKLMPEMLRGGLRRDDNGYYLIKGSNLTEKEINTAHREEHYAEAKILAERHRRQRHTVSSDLIWGWEKLLREERTKSKQSQGCLESDDEN
jgi:hypothetical protein